MGRGCKSKQTKKQGYEYSIDARKAKKRKNSKKHAHLANMRRKKEEKKKQSLIGQLNNLTLDAMAQQIKPDTNTNLAIIPQTNHNTNDIVEEDIEMEEKSESVEYEYNTRLKEEQSRCKFNFVRTDLNKTYDGWNRMANLLNAKKVNLCETCHPKD